MDEKADRLTEPSSRTAKSSHKRNRVSSNLTLGAVERFDQLGDGGEDPDFLLDGDTTGSIGAPDAHAPDCAAGRSAAGRTQESHHGIVANHHLEPNLNLRLLLSAGAGDAQTAKVYDDEYDR